MHFSWPETFRSGLRRSRRSKRSLGAQQTLESRALLSAVGVGQVAASVESPRVYGPLQLTTSGADTTDAEVFPAFEPPDPVPQDYNGLWDAGMGTSFQLQINNAATKIKGSFFNSELGDFKLKGKLDGLDVTAKVKGKTDAPEVMSGKLKISFTFALTTPTSWSGDYVAFDNKTPAGFGLISATKTT